jgi:hypothetical protein
MYAVSAMLDRNVIVGCEFPPIDIDVSQRAASNQTIDARLPIAGTRPVQHGTESFYLRVRSQAGRRAVKSAYLYMVSSR